MSAEAPLATSSGVPPVVIPGPRVPSARPVMAAGAVFRDRDGCVLLLRPTYKPGWEIPGGIVEPGESPADACAREVHEELGLTWRPGRLLVVDWAPSGDEGDKVLWIFDGGRLDSEPADLDLALDEVSEARWVGPGGLPQHAPARLARRVALAVRALATGLTLYAEHGHDLSAAPPPAPPAAAATPLPDRDHANAEPD